MTDNTKLKEDATELLDKLISFKRKYNVAYNFRMKDSSPADLFERELRMFLFVCRTDDENAQQLHRDDMC